MTTSRRTTDEWIKSRQDMTFVERLSDIQETDRDIKQSICSIMNSVTEFKLICEPLVICGDIEICFPDPVGRKEYPPYMERLHPQRVQRRKPFWFRTRSNPQRRRKGGH